MKAKADRLMTGSAHTCGSPFWAYWERFHCLCHHSPHRTLGEARLGKSNTVSCWHLLCSLLQLMLYMPDMYTRVYGCKCRSQIVKVFCLHSCRQLCNHSPGSTDILVSTHTLNKFSSKISPLPMRNLTPTVYYTLNAYLNKHLDET